MLSSGSSNNTIGGTTAIAGNTIAFSSSIGVDVLSGTGNMIRLNSIFSNAGLGIDLGGNGVTPNSAGGPHSGPNDLQNFPVITSAMSAGGTTTVGGNFNSTPNTTFTLDFYTISSLNASGYGEGRHILGSESVTTDPSGNLNGLSGFLFAFATPSTGAQYVTVTATDPGGNTSEFSQEFGTDQPPAARIGFANLTVNEGEPVSFDGTGSTSPSGDPLSYSWTFGDGRAATGAAPTHTYLSTGTDLVTLTVDDGFGGTSTAHATIVVVDVPPAFTPDSFTPPETYTTATAGNGFGTAVASVDGNVAIGAPLASSTGLVYLYDGMPTDDGVSSTYAYGALMHTFADPAAASGDQFGASIAVVGNELIVGAPGSSFSGSGNGAAYVFDANPDSGTFGQLLATLTIPSPVVGTGAQFGAAVGTTDTNIVIGAPGTSGGQGEAYEFEGDATQSNFGALLLAIPNPNPNALPLPASQFGAAVGGLGNDMIVGAPLGDPPLNPTLGKVYLFDGSSGTELTQISNPHHGTIGFGTSVASVGPNILIGSPADGSGGAAFLYSPSGPLIPLTSISSGTLLTTFAQPDDGGGNFGASVTGTQNTAFIGAPGATLGTASAGAAYLFDADPASPTFGLAIAAVQEPTPTTGGLFGSAVALDYGALVVGASSAAGAGAETVDLYQPGAL